MTLINAVAILSGISAVGNFVRAQDPKLLLAMFPNDKCAKGAKANIQSVKDIGKAPRLQMKQLAKEGLMGCPLFAPSLRVLYAANQKAGSGFDSRLIGLSSRVSRRDAATQLLLIERSVLANNILDALTSYDTVLRTSSDVRPLLYPVLTNAMDEPEVLRGLAKFLARKPTWRDSFIEFAISQGKRAETLTALQSALLAEKDSFTQRHKGYVLGRLDLERRYNLALDFYSSNVNSKSGIVRNGSFEKDDLFPPVEWGYRDDVHAEASPQKIDGRKGRALVLFAEADRRGEVARQVVKLPVGKALNLVFLTSGLAHSTQANAKLELICAAPPNRVLIKLNLPPDSDRPQRMIGPISPMGKECEVQLLRVMVENGPIENDAWVDDVQILEAAAK